MIKSVAVLLLSSLASFSQTVEVAVTPVSLKPFAKLARLDKVEVGLWNVFARNDDGTTAANISIEDIALACGQVRPLTAIETAMFLTAKQTESKAKAVSDIFADGALGAAVFYSPWFLIAKPVIDKVQAQIDARTPDETQLIGMLNQDSITLMPGAKGHFSFVGSLIHGAAPCHAVIAPGKPPLSPALPAPAASPGIILRPQGQTPFIQLNGYSGAVISWASKNELYGL